MNDKKDFHIFKTVPFFGLSYNLSSAITTKEEAGGEAG